MFYGSITALITPFKGEEIDWPAFDQLVEWQIEQGSNGLVPCGTTGESPTLSHAEHKAIVERCVNVVKGRIPVLAGSGSNNYREALELTQHACAAGADAALVVTPYYNKPSQEGLYTHFKMLSENADIPIIIYNIPGRSMIDMGNETLARLAELPGIIGVKDATNDLQRPVLLRQMVAEDFCCLSGEDGTVAGFLAQGGQGIISVTSNVAPKACSELHNAWRTEDMQTFKEIRDRLASLNRALFIETSPQPVKYAASRLGLCSDQCRLPLLPASISAREAVNKAMVQSGLLSEESPAILRAHG